MMTFRPSTNTGSWHSLLACTTYCVVALPVMITSSNLQHNKPKSRGQISLATNLPLLSLSLSSGGGGFKLRQAKQPLASITFTSCLVQHSLLLSLTSAYKRTILILAKIPLLFLYFNENSAKLSLFIGHTLLYRASCSALVSIYSLPLPYSIRFQLEIEFTFGNNRTVPARCRFEQTQLILH